MSTRPQWIDHISPDERKAYCRNQYHIHRESIRAYRKAKRRESPVCCEKLKKSWRRRKAEEAAGRPCPEACEFDHDHTNGRFRGWLCHRCNIVLGYVKDSPGLLRKMVTYLDPFIESEAA